MTDWAVWWTTWRTRRLAILWAVAICLLASRSLARPEYPGDVQAAIGSECPPPCVMCHVFASGGKNWTPFGLRIMPHSIVGTPWPQTFAALRQADVDSDGDGRQDMVEIDQGTNPSQTGDDTIVCPKYGCGARIAPGQASQAEIGVVAFAAAAVLMLARRGAPQNAARRRSLARGRRV